MSTNVETGTELLEKSAMIKMLWLLEIRLDVKQIAQGLCWDTIAQVEDLLQKMFALRSVPMDTQLILKLVMTGLTKLGMFKMEETVAMRHAQLK